VDEVLSALDAALGQSARTLAEQGAELEQRRARIAQLDRVCVQLSDKVVERERELGEARAELERVRVETESGMRSLLVLAAEIERVRSQARGQATRIRMRALGDAVELAARLQALIDGPAASRGRLLDSLQAAIERIGPEQPVEEVVELEPALNGNGEADADRMFEGMIEVEVGPFADFSQLVGFEDAAGGIGATSEVSVKRFARGRATLEMKLAEPVELLAELEQRAPFEFKVRDRRFDRVVLDLESE
jgi:hypothetical protein